MLEMMLPRKAMPTCRPYQLEQVTKILEQWELGLLKVLCVSATGSGKTTTAGFIIKHEVGSGGRVLIVTDRKKLTRQFALRTETDFGIPCGIEMASEGHGGEDCVACTVQTITSRIADGKFHPEDFALLIFDEAHLALGAGFQAVAKHFSKAKVLGLTATPVASQQRDLLKFFNVKIEPITLKELIEQKWLAPITVKNFPIHIRIEATSKQADFNDEDIGHSIDPYLEMCADEMVSLAGGRCSLVFLPLIATSKRFTSLLNERGLVTQHVDGTMGEKEVNACLARLEMGTVDCLTCAQILAVGVDCKPVNLILSLRPTKSWTSFVQQVGRGTRMFDPAKDGPKGTKWAKKQDLLLCDPLWLVERHDLLQTPAILFAKDEVEAEEIKAVLKRKSGGNLLEAVNTSRGEHEERLRKRLEEMSQRKGRQCSMMDLALGMNRMDLAEYEPTHSGDMQPMTQSQRDAFIRAGFNFSGITSKGQAAEVLNLISDRRGLCTLRMAKFGHSLNHPDPYRASFEEMKKFLDTHAYK